MFLAMPAAAGEMEVSKDRKSITQKINTHGWVWTMTPTIVRSQSRPRRPTNGGRYESLRLACSGHLAVDDARAHRCGAANGPHPARRSIFCPSRYRDWQRGAK